MSALALIAATASLHSIDVPKTFGIKTINHAARKGELAVELPQAIRSEFSRLHPDLTITHRGFELDLGAVKHCRDATVCGVATFIGRRNSKPHGTHRIALTHDIVGRYTPSQCGASCSAPRVEWTQGHGDVWGLSVKGLTRSRLRAKASSAIVHGDRSTLPER